MAYLTLLGSIIQSIAALMGIVSIILIFLVEQKLSMAIKILDNLYEKYIFDELNSNLVKRILMLYVHKLDDIRLSLKILNILAIFYILSTLIIFICLILLVEINNFYSIFTSFFSIILILFFLKIVYNFGKAPYSAIFEKWSPESIMNEPQYKEVLGRYLGYFDREDILELYSNLKNYYLFCWDEIPGNDDERLIKFLNQNYGIELQKNVSINKRYLFCWDDIPGKHDERLIKFLKKKFGIDWVKTAKIEKIDDDKTIRLSLKNNWLSLKLNDEKTKVSLKIDDGRTDEFIVKLKNGKPSIYKKINDDRTIEISMKNEISHLLVLELNNENTKVNLKIHNGRSDEFIVKKIKGKRNIYKKLYPFQKI